MIYKFYEFINSNLEPIKSFKTRDTLNPKVWNGFDIDQDIRMNLLQIAGDFYESTELEVDVIDIVLVGSLANYNWSEKYSDYDLHIKIDYSKINDDENLVKNYVYALKSTWNAQHDIKIAGFEVEVYLEDIKEPPKSSGVFSLLKNKWLSRPTKIDKKIDIKTIKDKATSIMNTVDILEEDIDVVDWIVYKDKIDSIWNKVKNFRKDGLIESGEYSVGNLIFKLLRRNGYINKIINLKRQSYDKQYK